MIGMKLNQQRPMIERRSGQHARQGREIRRHRAHAQLPAQQTRGQEPDQQVEDGEDLDRRVFIAQHMPGDGVRQMQRRIGQRIHARGRQRHAQEQVRIVFGKHAVPDVAAADRIIGQTFDQIVVLREVVRTANFQQDQHGDEKRQTEPVAWTVDRGLVDRGPSACVSRSTVHGSRSTVSRSTIACRSHACPWACGYFANMKPSSATSNQGKSE